MLSMLNRQVKIIQPNGFVQLTRVYLKKSTDGKKVLKKQRFLLAVAAFESVRARTKLGKGHNSTILTKTGREINVEQTYDQLLKLLYSGTK